MGSSSLTRDRTRPPALRVQSLSQWTTREVPSLIITVMDLYWEGQGEQQVLSFFASLLSCIPSKTPKCLLPPHYCSVSQLGANFVTQDTFGDVETFWVVASWGASEVTQSCPTLCDPMGCSPPGSSVHGILQARIPEWVAVSFSRRSSQPRDRTWVSRTAGRHFNLGATREAHLGGRGLLNLVL